MDGDETGRGQHVVDLAGGHPCGEELWADDEAVLAGAETVEGEFVSHAAKYTEGV